MHRPTRHCKRSVYPNGATIKGSLGNMCRSKFQKDEALANDDMETMSGNSVLETYIDMLDDILHDLISPSERQLSNAEANADNDRHAA